MTWTVPNILTLLRLVAAPLVAIVFIGLARPYADIVALALFVAASLTDYVDGALARAWQQQTKLGTMLDPIADKAMVIIALATLMAFSSLSGWIILPAAFILLREVFVSGLREFLGDVAGTLKVTRLAKWKTTVQMVAIATLLAHGIAEHYAGMAVWGMDVDLVNAILSGTAPDTGGLRQVFTAMDATAWGGLALLWIAAALTLISGVDYLTKALPHLREDTT